MDGSRLMQPPAVFQLSEESTILLLEQRSGLMSFEALQTLVVNGFINCLVSFVLAAEVAVAKIGGAGTGQPADSLIIFFNYFFERFLLLCRFSLLVLLVQVAVSLLFSHLSEIERLACETTAGFTFTKQPDRKSIFATFFVIFLT